MPQRGPWSLSEPLRDRRRSSSETELQSTCHWLIRGVPTRCERHPAPRLGGLVSRPCWKPHNRRFPGTDGWCVRIGELDPAEATAPGYLCHLYGLFRLDRETLCVGHCDCADNSNYTQAKTMEDHCSDYALFNLLTLH